MRTVKEFASFSGFLRSYLVKEVSQHPSSDDLTKILREHPKLVVAMNHGPMSGPLAGAVGVFNQYFKHGGADRKPVMVAWRGFYRVPVIRKFVGYMSQVNKPLNLNGFIRRLTNNQATDVFVMPEGENCSFGNGLDIEPFLSPRFIEIALKADVPILISVHVGSELWSNIIKVDKRFDPLFKLFPEKSFERIQESRRINWSLSTRKKIPELQMCFRLYKPNMTLADLHEPGGKQKLQQESDTVRKIMQSMVDDIVHVNPLAATA